MAIEECFAATITLELFLHDASLEYWASWLCAIISREGTSMVVDFWHWYNETMHLLELWGVINQIISKVPGSLLFDGT